MVAHDLISSSEIFYFHDSNCYIFLYKFQEKDHLLNLGEVLTISIPSPNLGERKRLGISRNHFFQLKLRTKSKLQNFSGFFELNRRRNVKKLN